MEKLHLAVRIWIDSLLLRATLRHQPLPEVVARLSQPRQGPQVSMPPVALGRIVRRVLTVGRRPPRCLISALVTFQLLRAGGHHVELIIGLPLAATDKDAHAWLEFAGRDVGPPPGQAGHVELARYG